MITSISTMRDRILSGIRDANLDDVLLDLQDPSRIALLPEAQEQILNSVDDTINTMSAALIQMRIIKKIIDRHYGIE